MEKNVGLWIDHEKAFLVAIAEDAESRHRLSFEWDEVEPPGGMDYSSDTKQTRRRTNQLKSWYKEVMGAVSDADRIYIFGPGEAKRELLRAMEKQRALAEKVVGMDSIGTLTENQMAAQVRKFYRSTDETTVPRYRRAPGS